MASSKDYNRLDGSTILPMQRSGLPRPNAPASRSSFEFEALGSDLPANTSKSSNFTHWFAQLDTWISEKLGLNEKRRIVSLFRAGVDRTWKAMVGDLTHRGGFSPANPRRCRRVPRHFPVSIYRHGNARKRNSCHGRVLGAFGSRNGVYGGCIDLFICGCFRSAFQSVGDVCDDGYGKSFHSKG